MKEKLSSKIRYYKGQYEAAIDKFVDSNKKADRDRAIRTKERVKCYQKMLEIVNAEK